LLDDMGILYQDVTKGGEFFESEKELPDGVTPRHEQIAIRIRQYISEKVSLERQEEWLRKYVRCCESKIRSIK
jgi:hypothetical protein